YKPFRVRQGEQEGLGLVNPDLTERMTLYTGGFPAEYGGKLSSALDVRYKRPAVPEGSAYASLLDAGATVGASGLDGRVSWVAGVRKARARRLFGTQELKGTYDPDYTDLQANLTFDLGNGHTFEALGLWAQHEFQFEPSNQRTYFGTFSNLQSIWIDYAGNETDGYQTGFAGARLTTPLGRLRAQHALSLYDTEETEQFNVRGSAVLYLVDNPFEADAETGEGLIPTGSARQEDFADNIVEVRTLTAQGTYSYLLDRAVPEAGWYVRSLEFGDALNEKSVVTGRSIEGLPIRTVVDSLNAAAAFDATQAGGFIQTAIDLLPTRNQFVLTAGLRLDHTTFNSETTISPRLTARYSYSPTLTFTGSWGVYHQTPTYRELRGRAALDTETGIATNLLSQRSIQYVGGFEYFIPRRRMYIRAEAYYKDLDQLISYDVSNVRITYSGENDAVGSVYGFDLQLRGELVPGLESWLNYGFMVGRETFLPEQQTQFTTGDIARPTDQRHTFSLFIQDYVPGDPSWKLHMRALFGSGLPYTPPVPGETIGNLVTQEPGARYSERYPEYKRLDLGATKTLNLLPRSFADRTPVRLHLTGEVLNVFDMVNTVAYTWVTGSEGIWNRIPTRLTPRTINLRARVTF
ncbi:MAG: TonB-dependent receptor, partial [Bacteroidota bacterium]